jgi:hypothetical protein
MNDILNFLSDNYIYVSGVGLIIIIILIGFLASKRKARKVGKDESKETMVNINDVQTGGINQVADSLKKEEEKPVEVTPTVPVQDALVVEQEPVVPVMNQTNMEQPTLDPNPTINPAFENKNPFQTPINDGSQFEKTEVMDFSDINGFNQNTANSNEPVSFTPDASQTNNDNMLNGEETVNTTNDQNQSL